MPVHRSWHRGETRQKSALIRPVPARGPININPATSKWSRPATADGLYTACRVWSSSSLIIWKDPQPDRVTRRGKVTIPARYPSDTDSGPTRAIAGRGRARVLPLVYGSFNNEYRWRDYRHDKDQCAADRRTDRPNHGNAPIPDTAFRAIPSRPWVSLVSYPVFDQQGVYSGIEQWYRIR